MSMLRRSRRRGMVIGAAAASRANSKRAAAQPAPVAAAAPAPIAPNTDDAIEQVKKLAELRDQGVLTEAEFDAKKKQLLGL